MSGFTGMVESIANQIKPKSELYDIEYESIIEYLSSKEHLLNELMNDMLYSGDLPLVRNYNELPSLMDSKVGMREQICTWFASEYDLTPSQKKLNKELLNTLKCLTSYYSSFDNTEPLEKFLHDNKNNKDLKVILNLKRGESESIVLHAVAGGKIDEYRSLGNRAIDLLLDAGADPNMQNNKGKTPLYLATARGHYDNANSLLLKGANPNITSRKGKTPQQIATNNNRPCYHMEELFLTDKQKKLTKELYDLLVLNSDCIKNLKDFLSKYEGDSDLKVVLNIWQGMKVLLHIEDLSWDPEDENSVKQLKKMVLEAGALGSSININRPKQKKGQASTLLVKLTSSQKEKLREFSDKVFQAKNMVELEEIVNDAIKSGIRLNYSSSQDFFLGNEYTFTDYVIKKISELEKNPKVASSIICRLVSKGAVFGNTVDVNMINTVTSEFTEHRTNMKKAYADYIRNAHKFIEAAKSATSGELKDARIDNSVFYLEYFQGSKIDIAKITDKTRDLGLVQGEIEYGRDIIKIGKSEVEIITENGIRNYTDLADNSDIVLTFYISEGELEVRLYPDMRNKDLIRVEVNNQGLLERLKNCNEKIGKNCLLGGLPVNQAIEQGFFVRSGKLMRSEAMSQSNGQKKGSWCERISRASNSEQTTSRAMG